ncbi:MAG: single-stranded DNA-binding protein [Candidatus Sumerlaeia bacterium]|nr:single-stranded DNA-binding protein [Candidatus Sumerlaeia bacterium]
MLEINRVFLLGNLTRDPEIHYTMSGTMVAQFDLAVNRTYRDKNEGQKQETLFIRVETFSKLAEFVSKYLKKGRKIYVEGRLRTTTWEGKDKQRRERIVVCAERIQFADPKPAGVPGKEPEPEEIAETEFTEEKPIIEEIPEPDITAEEKKTENDLPF